MNSEKMLDFFKQLVFDYKFGRKTKKQIVHELVENIPPSEGVEIPNHTDKEKFLFNLYWDLFDLTHDPPFHTRDIKIEYYLEVFEGKRRYSSEDLLVFWNEKGIDDMFELPD
jgi:hypothetical protein